MAYEKQTWECGETITADKLNHMEDGIANAGGGDCGFECTETRTPLTEESVTTVAEGPVCGGKLSYSQLIDADIIRVTFNGTVYECRKSIDDVFPGVSAYGAFWDKEMQSFDWSQYPFNITSGTDGTQIATQVAGTYSVKIEAVGETVETTPCFRKAVESVNGGASPTGNTALIVHVNSGNFDTTSGEIVTAITQGVPVFVLAAYGEFGGQILSYNYEDRQNNYTFYVVNGGNIFSYQGTGTDSFPSDSTHS